MEKIEQIEQDLSTARESITNLTNRLEALEWYIAGLVAKNCLLQPETKVVEQPVLEAGESHSTDDKA